MVGVLRLRRRGFRRLAQLDVRRLYPAHYSLRQFGTVWRIHLCQQIPNLRRIPTKSFENNPLSKGILTENLRILFRVETY